MKRIGLYLLWFLVIVESIFIATWIFNDYVHREKPQKMKSTELLNPAIARESIVLIENQSDTTWHGTGFFVAPDKIATNIHVIAHPGPVVAKTIHQEKEIIWTRTENGIMSGTYENRETNWVVEGVCAYDVKNDIAILKVDGDGTPFVLGNSRWIKKNEPITVIGFPSKKFKFKNGNVYGIRKSDKWIRKEIVLSGGISGSPVLNKKGKVIGIYTYTQYNIGYSLSPPSSVLKKLLARSDKLVPLEEWQHRDSIRAYSHYINGQNKFNQKEYQESIKELERAIQLAPATLYAYTKLGEARSQLAASERKIGNEEKSKNLYMAAIDDYTSAIRINSKNESSYSRRGNVHFELGNHASALSDYNKAIKINPRYTQLFHIQGMNKIEQGDVASKEGNHESAQKLYEDAVTYYNYAIKRDRKSAFLYQKRANAESNLGRSLANQGDVENARPHYQNAIEDSNKAITLRPESASAYNGRAHAQYQFAHFEKDQNNIDEATALFQSAIKDWSVGIELQPEEHFKNHKLADIHRNIGISKIELADIETQRNKTGKAIVLYSSAIDDLTEAIQLNPKNTYAYSNRAWVYYLLGKHELEIGNIEQSQKLYEFGINDCDTSSRINPDNAFAFYNRGVIHVAMGNISSALIDFDRAIFLNPRYADAYYQRGLVKNDTADLDRAKELDPNVGK